MVTQLRIVMILFFVCLPLLNACSDDKEKKENKEKGVIEQATDKAAKEAVDRIKVPLEQAKTAADKETARSRQLEEQEKRQ